MQFMLIEVMDNKMNSKSVVKFHSLASAFALAFQILQFLGMFQAEEEFTGTRFQFTVFERDSTRFEARFFD